MNQETNGLHLAVMAADLTSHLAEIHKLTVAEAQEAYKKMFETVTDSFFEKFPPTD